MKALFRAINRRKTKHYVTIVSGLPRSGTSMLMKMLEAGGMPLIADHLRTADDDNPKGYYEFERVKKLPEGDFGWIEEAKGQGVKIISALLKHLPGDYAFRVLFLRRAIPEILASQKKMLIRRNKDPNQIQDEEMTQLYLKHLGDVESWLGEQENIQTLKIDYNQIIADPAPGINEINRFLDKALDTDAMLRIVDPSLYRQRGEK
ncbi:MAG: sulfotransferase domain-containing protein [Magnetococcales bacterium]|nr:sulfotransferase domain-containing protein [Magnetococcales bacterium]